MGGITRIHGSSVPYSGHSNNFEGVALQEYTITFWSGDVQAAGSTALSDDVGDAGGALDQIFKTATGQIGTVGRIGTLNTTTRTLRFSLEALGDSDLSNAVLGTGPNNDGTGAGYGSTTAAALQSRIQALGTVNGVHLTSATVAAFVF
jgi:hypothetical protein